MTAIRQVTGWPVEHAAAASVTPDVIDRIGDRDRVYRLASLSKPMTAWAIMVGVEEGIVTLDDPIRHVAVQPGVTLRHLLSHAAGYGFDGQEPVSAPERRRMYSNTGIEYAAAELARAARMRFEDYLVEAVFDPLGMSTAALRGSPAHGVRATLDDTVAFVAEMLSPRLVAPETYAAITTAQYPDLAGVVPDVGRFDPCPWGLGVEIHGDKSPHWMGSANSAATFGHFGGSGTMMWVDPEAHVGVVALTDRPFDEWRDDALRVWPELSDAVLREAHA